MEKMTIMRKFHNSLKLDLYNKYASNSESLLDIGTGRGGDIMKWHKCNIKQVIGIDINKEYITEAISRCRNTQISKSRDYKFYYTYENMIFKKFLEGRNLYKKYNSISCMFAIHYFFNSYETLVNLFSEIKNSLTPGGYFFGTCMDGQKVSELLKDRDVYSTESMFIRKEYNELKNIGSKIDFMLSSTLYFGDKMLSSEYLVFKNTLEQVGNTVGLTFIESNSFSMYHKNEIYPLDEYLKESSFLNMTFVFQNNKLD